MSQEIVNAVHKDGQTKMSTHARQATAQQLTDLKSQLQRVESKDGVTSRPDMLQSVPHIKRRIAQLEEVLNRDDDLVAKDTGERTKLSDRKKEIEAIIRKEMPSEREQALRVNINERDFNRAVEKTISHQQRYGKLIQEWQEIMRRLEPDDPTAADTRKLL